MNSNAKVVSPQYVIISEDVQNKGFLLLDQMFKSHEWHLTKNDMNWISYTKVGNETSYFDIKIDKTTIYVSVPVKNTTFQYNTSFNNYFIACEYIEKRFHDFII